MIQALFSNNDIQLDTYKVEGEIVYRLTFFKDNHWNGDISFTQNGIVRYDELGED